MPCSPPVRARHANRAPWLLIGQGAIVTASLLAIVLAPPADGAMLLIPIDGDMGPTITLAIAHGARLIDTGPVRGSVVVTGRREAILPAMLAAGTVAIAATPALCGTSSASPARSPGAA